MNELTRTITSEILSRAKTAIARGEAKGPKLDQCWKRLEKLKGGIVGAKSWEQIRRIAESDLADEKVKQECDRDRSPFSFEKSRHEDF